MGPYLILFASLETSTIPCPGDFLVLIKLFGNEIGTFCCYFTVSTDFLSFRDIYFLKHLIYLSNLHIIFYQIMSAQRARLSELAHR